MQVVPVDPETYGQFHTGDSYIVLSVRYPAMYRYFYEIFMKFVCEPQLKYRQGLRCNI